MKNDSTATPDPLDTVPAEERPRIDRGARACGRTKGYDTCRACIDREVRAWHAAHPARAEGLPLFDGPPRSLYQPNGPDGSPEDCDPETLTPAEEAEIIASAPGQIGPGQTPIGDAERDPCAVREGYCGALSARAMACTRKPHTDGDHVAEGAIGEVIERWTTAAARVTEDELAEIERAAKQIRDGNWPPPGAATILLCERTSDLADEVRALRGERDQSAHTIAALQAERESENEGARRLMARVAALESELAARPAPAADASLEALGRIVRAAWVEVAKKEAKTVPGYVDLWKWLEIPDADTDRKIGEQVVRAVDASRPAAPEVDDDEPLTRGTRVRTVAHLTALFSPSLHPHRRSNALGKIVRRMTSGDIYYDVRHDDGTVAGYERSELIDLTADASRPGLTEELARLDFETACREARARGGAYCITKLGEALSTLDAALRASRGETGPAPDPRATPHAGDPASLADVVAASAREPHADVVLHALHVSGGAAAIGVESPVRDPRVDYSPDMHCARCDKPVGMTAVREGEDVLCLPCSIDDADGRDLDRSP